MQFKLKISHKAQKNIENITHYISNILKSPKAAQTFLENVDKAFELICITPEVYKKYNNKNIRVFYVNNFNIYYYVDIDNDSVIILRVIYGKRDILKHFDD